MSDRKCPNCGAVGVPGANDTFACPTCGGSFTFVSGEAKVTRLGELDEFREKLDKHDVDLAELKKTLPASSPAADPEISEDPADEDLDDDEEDL